MIPVCLFSVFPITNLNSFEIPTTKLNAIFITSQLFLWILFLLDVPINRKCKVLYLIYIANTNTHLVFLKNNIIYKTPNFQNQNTLITRKTLNIIIKLYY